ncbi:MAG: site-specific integrase [Candidatus Bathyarchaeota archaeon]
MHHPNSEAIKSLYRRSGIQLNIDPLENATRVTYRGRALTQEQIVKILEVTTDLRERVIVSVLALSGLREGTLLKLQYKHIREDLEKNIVPIHIHIEADITKGAYTDYDTFLGEEAVHYLKLYLEERRRGKIKGKEVRIEPEVITDCSPLILCKHNPIPLGRSGLLELLHQLFLKAGIISQGSAKVYPYRGHSFRKFFKTQMEALGVKSEFTEYMLGHKISVYHDIDIEHLRRIYASSGLSLKPKTTSKREMLENMIRALGENPEVWLVKKAQAEPHRIVVSTEEEDLSMLRNALREILGKGL